MGGGGSSPPQYVMQTAAQPDPTQTANAQQTYNINAGIAQNQLNNTNQVTPYGDITYTKTGGDYVGASPAVAATPATGGYWNGYAWIPTGGSPGKPANPGQFVPQYTATTKLNPLTQSLVDQSIYNARGVGGLETSLIGQQQNMQAPKLDWNSVNYLMYGGKGPGYKPLDLSWGNIQNNIWGLERNSLDPYWKQQQDVKNQQLADQGLTPGSQGWKYEQTQFGTNKSNAYDKAMLDAQSQASQDLQAQYNSRMQAYQLGSQNMLSQYNAPLNALSSLRSSSQIAQPGVGQTAQTATANVQPGPYATTANSNYATASNYNAQIAGLQNQDYLAQQKQQSDMLGGLFGLVGNLAGPIGGLIGSDRRDKTDIKKLGLDQDTKLPMYAYRYKDDPKSYPKVVGPMAQDVEKKYPGSTTEVDGHMAIKVPFGLGA